MCDWLIEQYFILKLYINWLIRSNWDVAHGHNLWTGCWNLMVLTNSLIIILYINELNKKYNNFKPNSCSSHSRPHTTVPAYRAAPAPRQPPPPPQRDRRNGKNSLFLASLYSTVCRQCTAPIKTISLVASGLFAVHWLSHNYNTGVSQWATNFRLYMVISEYIIYLDSMYTWHNIKLEIHSMSCYIYTIFLEKSYWKG